jgi:hypothetical protein
MLASKKVAEDRVHVKLAGMDKQVRRLSQLLEELFDLSQLRAGSLSLQREEVE